MVGHGGSSAGSYLADPTSPILSHYASIVMTSTLRVKIKFLEMSDSEELRYFYSYLRPPGNEYSGPLYLYGDCGFAN